MVAMSPEAVLKRLFIGTFLSPAQKDALAQLSTHKAELEKQFKCKIRFVKPHKLHLTWVFLGNVDSTKIKDIEETLQPIAGMSKRLHLDYKQVELWPNVRRPRMIVLTPEEVPSDVQLLKSTISSAFNNLGKGEEHAPSKGRAYTPHITLARFEDAHSAEIPEWFVQKCFLPIKHEIEKIELIESELGKNSDEYKSLYCFNLL